MYSCAPPVWDLHAVSGLGSPLRSHSARVTRRWTAARCAATIVGDEHADRRGTMPPMRGVARGASSRSPIGTMHRWAQPHSWPAGPGQPSCGHGGPSAAMGTPRPTAVVSSTATRAPRLIGMPRRAIRRWSARPAWWPRRTRRRRSPWASGTSPGGGAVLARRHGEDDDATDQHNGRWYQPPLIILCTACQGGPLSSGAGLGG